MHVLAADAHTIWTSKKAAPPKILIFTWFSKAADAPKIKSKEQGRMHRKKKRCYEYLFHFARYFRQYILIHQKLNKCIKVFFLFKVHTMKVIHPLLCKSKARIGLALWNVGYFEVSTHPTIVISSSCCFRFFSAMVRALQVINICFVLLRRPAWRGLLKNWMCGLAEKFFISTFC